MARSMSADVSIRPFREEDAEALFEAVRESVGELSPWMPWCHSDYSISEARDWIESKIAAFETRDEFHFAIVEAGGQVVGVCGLNQISRENRVANLGYWVRSSQARRGIATRATRLLTDWAFQNTDLNRLEILVAIQNLSSLRVAAKAGAVWEGVLRARLQNRGAVHDAVLFSIVRPLSRRERVPRRGG
ncbi:MAG TPA: GNAT family N-acetyltransferase [Terriglobia bacterium]|nr:GNAT family N-acetyltransferase [Terriglobia bacterium]